MSYARKVDTSQRDIVQAFEQAGWSVLDTSRVGGGAPDLFVAKRGVTIAVECKTGKKKRQVNQVEWEECWHGLYLWGSNPLELLEVAENLMTENES